MYYSTNSDQLMLDDFALPFGGKLRANNRWVKLSQIMPWDHIEQIYMNSMSTETGRPAIPARIAFGAIFIKESEDLTDEECVTAISENPYMQYFLGLDEFEQDPLFDPSMMVRFRKRFPAEYVSQVNEFVCTGKWPEEESDSEAKDVQEILEAYEAQAQQETQEQEDNDQDDDDKKPPKSLRGKKNPNTSRKKQKRQKKNKGKLIIDATVAPSDIKYPTDIDLLNQCRTHLETAVDCYWAHVPHKGHKLPYSPKKARKSYLNISKSKKWTAKKLRAGIQEQLRYIELAFNRLNVFVAQVPDLKLPRYLLDRLEVIPKVYAQQKEMFEKNTHTCADRIVSLAQPFVRPIQRGKRPNPTEFGQKLHLSVVDGYTYLERISWSNFNEGCDLKSAVEAYHKRFGYYPEAVLADRIYQTRENRKYCKELGIRLTGPALGRKKAGDTGAKEARQMYKDSCERNVVEGRNGNLKRRYGLDLIMSKLQETSETEAMLNILAMNADHRLRRWLMLFFGSRRILPVLQ